MVGRGSSFISFGFSEVNWWKSLRKAEDIEIPLAFGAPKHSSKGFMPSLKMELKKFGVSWLEGRGSTVRLPAVVAGGLATAAIAEYA